MPRGYTRSVEELIGLAGDTVKSRPVADAVVRKTTIDQTANMALAHATAPEGIVDFADYSPVDDGLPPSTPANVTVTPIIEGLTVNWNSPPPEERVKAADVRITPAGAASATQRASILTGDTLLGLDSAITYSIEVRLIDAFADASPWSPPVQATPQPSAIDFIDLAEIEIAGTLGWANLDPLTDPAKIGDDVITARTIATQNAAALNLWVADAAILSAKIANLVADKITGGTINTTNINVASRLTLIGSGQIVTSGGGLTADDEGVTLQVGADYNTLAINTDRKISSGGEWANLAFWSDSALDLRGAVIRSDGESGGKDGAVVLHATRAGNLGDATSARVEAIAMPSRGEVRLYDDVYVEHALDVGGNADVGGVLDVGGNADVGGVLDVGGNATAANYYLRSGGNLASVKTLADRAAPEGHGHGFGDLPNDVERTNHTHNYAPVNHSHPVPNHTHYYYTYTGALWETAKWTRFVTGPAR